MKINKFILSNIILDIWQYFYFEIIYYFDIMNYS